MVDLGQWDQHSCSVSHRAIDDKYSRREEYRGFTQDFKEKDGYKPDVKIEYVDETGRKLTPKEVLGWGRLSPLALTCPRRLNAYWLTPSRVDILHFCKLSFTWIIRVVCPFFPFNCAPSLFLP